MKVPCAYCGESYMQGRDMWNHTRGGECTGQGKQRKTKDRIAALEAENARLKTELEETKQALDDMSEMFGEAIDNNE